MTAVLGSASPRRIELLKLIIPEFEVMPADNEEPLDTVTYPELELAVSVVACAKAGNVYGRRKYEKQDGGDYTVITADTIVALEDGTVFGKPKDAADAAGMLKAISGKTHYVYTGVCVVSEDNMDAFTEKTAVTVSELTDSEIDKYVNTGEPFDKAGAYAVQGLFAPYIEKINGDYYNVVGLPLCTLRKTLKRFF